MSKPTNRPIERGAYAQLVSNEDLRQRMYEKDQTLRSLAARVEELGADYDPAITCSKATIGHLMTGHTAATDTQRARLIEKVLQVRRGGLFDFKLANRALDISRVA